MKKSKFTEQQIAFALRQAETGTKIKEVVRQLGITEQTFYRWKRKYGGLGVGYQNPSGASVGGDESLESGHYAASRHT